MQNYNKKVILQVFFIFVENNHTLLQQKFLFFLK